MEWQTLVIEPARRPSLAAGILGRLLGLVLIAGALMLCAGCGSIIPGNRLVRYADADVLFTTPAEVDRLCKLAPRARLDRVYRGCYVSSLNLAVVGHGDREALEHERRHAREGAFHPNE